MPGLQPHTWSSLGFVSDYEGQNLSEFKAKMLVMNALVPCLDSSEHVRDFKVYIKIKPNF